MNTSDDHNDNTPSATLNLDLTIDTAFRVSLAVIFIAYQTQYGEPDSALSLLSMGLMVLAVSYCALGFLFTFRPSISATGNSILPMLAHVDSLIAGIVIGLFGFPVNLLVITTPLIVIRGINHGGVTQAISHLLSYGVGSGLVLLVFSPKLSVIGTDSISLVGLVTATLFLAYQAFLYYRRVSKLNRELTASREQIVSLKLTNYKISKYLSPTLRKAIYSGKGVKLDTQRKKISIFFSDIKGFSELSEKMETETLTELLNQYLTEMSDIAIKFGGTVDKFMGDGIMVFFGDPITRGAKADCVACVSMAIAMQKRMQELRQRWQNQGFKEPLHVRMGINTGFCTVGNFGTESRLDYTLLGTEVNLASRLESAASPGEITVSEATYELIKDVILCKEKPALQLKGFQNPVKAYTAIDLRKNLGKEDSYVEHSTDGFSMYLDLEKIKNYERPKVMEQLEQAYEQVRRRTVPPKDKDVGK